MAKRNDPPRRQRGARSTASVGSIERHIEKAYGLPEKSVSIKNPSGRKARVDKQVKNVKKDWEKTKNE
jgi:hypothetical protein